MIVWLNKVSAANEPEVLIHPNARVQIHYFNSGLERIFHIASNVFKKQTPSFSMPLCVTAEPGGFRWPFMAAALLILKIYGYLEKVENYLAGSCSAISTSSLLSQENQAASENMMSMIKLLSSRDFVDPRKLLLHVTDNIPWLGSVLQKAWPNRVVIDNQRIVEHMIKHKLIVPEKLSEMEQKLWIPFFNLNSRTTQYETVNGKSKNSIREMIVGASSILNFVSAKGDFEGDPIIDSVIEPIGLSQVIKLDYEMRDILFIRSHHWSYRSKSMGLLGHLLFKGKYDEEFFSDLQQMHIGYNKDANRLEAAAEHGHINMITPPRDWESWFKTFDNSYRSQVRFAKLGVKAALQFLEAIDWPAYMEQRENSWFRKLIGSLKPVDFRGRAPEWAFE